MTQAGCEIEQMPSANISECTGLDFPFDSCHCGVIRVQLTWATSLSLLLPSAAIENSILLLPPPPKAVLTKLRGHIVVRACFIFPKQKDTDFTSVPNLH